MQGDGNLVIYDASRSALWATNTTGHPGAFLSVQEDGNVVIYTNSRVPVWATDTACESDVEIPPEMHIPEKPDAIVLPMRLAR